jgi:hypothetical protein
MRPIATSRQLLAEQVALRKAVRAMFADMASRLTGLIVRSADGGERIPSTRERRVLTSARAIVSGYFVGSDGRNAFAEDGVTALAPYPQILNYHVAHVQYRVATAHRDWMRRNVPEDIQDWLTRRPRSLAEVRIVDESPLAGYEAAHTWVDPNGYVLSDRIWQSGERTALKIDAFLSDNIRQGRKTLAMSRDLEGFLLPGRVGRRTRRPYGRDASSDAMRLARTEVSHAHAQMTLVASRANPYVSGIDWALSYQHPRFDVCDGLATLGMTGQRLREPYPLMAAPVPPAHPHCLCNARPAVTKRPDEVSAELRQAMQGNDRNPYRTPLDDAFVPDVLGRILFALLARRLTFGEMTYAA